MSDEKRQYLCLVSLKSPKGERVHLVEKSPFTVGRSTESDIVFPHAGISRKHLQVNYDLLKVEITDLNSANGTILNQNRIEKEKARVVQVDDVINLGGGEVTMYLQVIPRPIELASLESQKEGLKNSMYEVINKIEAETRNETLKNLEIEISEKRKAALSKIESEVRQELAETRQKQLNEIELQKKEIEKTKGDLEIEIRRMQTEIDGLNNEIHEKSEQAKTESNQIKNEIIAKAKAEAEATINEAKLKASESVLFAEAKAKEIQDQSIKIKALAEADLAQAQSKAQSILEKAHAEETSIQDKLRLAKEQADAIIKSAEENAQNLKSESDLKILQEYNEARKQSLGKLELEKSKLEDNIHGLELEILEKTHEAKSHVEKMTAKLFSEAQDRVAQLEHEASEKAAQQHRQAQAKYLETLNLAQKEADDLLASARNEAADARKSSQESAATTRKQAFEQAELYLTQAKKDAEEQIQTLLAESRQRALKTESEMLKSAEELCHKKQIEIIDSYRAQILGLQSQTSDLQQSKEKHLKTNSELEKSIETHTAAKNRAEQELGETSARLLSMKYELSVANETIEKAKLAAKEQIKVESEISKLKHQVQELSDQHRENSSKLEIQFKKLNEELLLKHDANLRSLEQELNQKRLKALESLKKQIETEEIRIREVRRHQATELARSVEIKLAGRLKDAFKNPQELGVLSQEIFNAVKETLINDESSLKPLTSHLSEVQVEKTEKRRQLARLLSATAAVVLISTALLNHEKLMGYFKSQEVNSVAQQMIEQRKIQSVYQPQQTAEYRQSYMDNVLYMKNYYEIKTNSDFQKAWTIKLNELELIKEMRVSEERMIKFIAIESNLVTQLFQLKLSIDAVYLNEGLERMRKLEEAETARLIEEVGSTANLKKIRDLENQAILKFIETHSKDFSN